MQNEQVTPIINTLVAAIVTAVITSDQFKAAVNEVIDARTKDVEDGSYEDLLKSDEFKEAVDDRIEHYDFEDTIKNVVSNMSFNVEVSRY